jgi:hypothetical protein
MMIMASGTVRMIERSCASAACSASSTAKRSAGSSPGRGGSFICCITHRVAPFSTTGVLRISRSR